MVGCFGTWHTNHTQKITSQSQLSSHLRRAKRRMSSVEKKKQTHDSSNDKRQAANDMNLFGKFLIKHTIKLVFKSTRQSFNSFNANFATDELVEAPTNEMNSKRRITRRNVNE